jgi:hypothetical protein
MTKSTGKGSVFQEGGGGTNFEQYVQSSFLATLIVRGNTPCILEATIEEIALQVKNRGYRTDDLLVIAKSSAGKHKLIVQAKHDLVFSNSESNTVFQDVITAFWDDFNNHSLFDKTKDRLVIVKGGLTKSERNNFKTLFNWAKHHNTYQDFFSEVNRIQVKKDALNIIVTAMESANDTNTIPQQTIWEFFKCLELLEYDFLNEGSVDESYIINLIKLTKNTTAEIDEKSIWDKIIAFITKYNPDGGSIDFKKISDDSLFQYFDIKKLDLYSESVQKLFLDSELILSPIKNSIGLVHFDRTELKSTIVNSVYSNSITIVEGKPGVGKSAIMKDLFQNEYKNANILTFKADQFHEPTLSNVLSKQGINEKLEDLFTCIALLNDRIIYIDSFEKLLESSSENAFSQFLSFIKSTPHIKVIVSCRQYATSLICLKYHIAKESYQKIEIPELTSEELKQVSEKYPQLLPILSNKRVKQLLKSPKYLDLLLTIIDNNDKNLDDISITNLKNILWKNIIENNPTQNLGLERKRHNAFLNIAVNRAIEMKLFTTPDNDLEDAIAALEKDHIIIKNGSEYEYAPSHDILEDWALSKHINNAYEKASDNNEFFESIGNSPAIRRAFRLWIEDSLIDNDENKIEFINSTIDDENIDDYWKDEVLIATFRSEDCSYFFTTHNQKLLENDGQLFNRCIHLIKTTCKNESNNFYIPTGSGWHEIIRFYDNHMQELQNQRSTIATFISEWKIKFFLSENITDEEVISVKYIVSTFIKEYENDDEYWHKEPYSIQIKELVNVLFSIVEHSEKEVTSLIERSKNRQDNWRMNIFYDNVIENVLSYNGASMLSKKIPQTIIDLAWDKWKLNPEKEKSKIFGHALPMGFEDAWGIKEKHSFFPAGIYKTPILPLLRKSPLVALDFISDFLNYSIGEYVKAPVDIKHRTIEVTIELNNKEKRTLYGCYELWATYRSFSTTHDAIQCILISLEHFLLECAKTKSKTSKSNIQYMFEYLLEKTNNVAIPSVLASVAMAYPEEVSQEMLPLFTVKEFFDWDSSRFASEGANNLEIADNKNPYAQEERYKQNNLPHRKKYFRGLHGFIIDYQFNIRELNQKIFAIIDKYKKELDPKDISWKKTLSEIDSREYKVTKQDEKKGSCVIEPNYDEDVASYISTGQNDSAPFYTAMEFSSIIDKTYKKETEIAFEDWLNIHNEYTKKEEKNFIHNLPVTLAAIGLRDFKIKLSKDNKEWCVSTIVNSLYSQVNGKLSGSYILDMNYNVLEKNISFNGLEYVYPILKESKEENIVIKALFLTLIAPFQSHETKKISLILNDGFLKENPDIAKQTFFRVIEFAKFRKENPHKHFYEEGEQEKAIKKEELFIDKFIEKTEFDIEIEKVNFSDYDAVTLSQISHFISKHNYNTFTHNFLLKLLNEIIEDLKLISNYDSVRDKRYRKLSYSNSIDVQYVLADLIIELETSYSKEIISELVQSTNLNSENKDIIEFCSNVTEFAILKLDDKISVNPENKETLISNFWIAWEHLFDLVKSTDITCFNKMLMLDIAWKSEGKDWSAINGKKAYYQKVTKELKETNTLSALNVLSTIGTNEFLPEGLSWLTDNLKESEAQAIYLVYPSGIRFIERLYYYHMETIKSNKKLTNNFIWVLNKMVKLGSTEAYFFRENVIMYKSNK